ncbi:cation:proton antiporter [Devosia sp. RR2S18]|uniref:cation:proton antiporter n=1 Tax=Devosia rhizosphaerae TaxID=3049774 RepID=UPI00253F7C8F|nr:cation:proton antiporter [Devosia sp. RR2S18]WIJ24156.1 cation:proton antiporter [Devosia sp. RR2S18]
MELSFPIEEPVLEFTVLVLAALLVQLTFRKLPVPALIGLLLIGMLIGPGALNVLAPDMAVELLGSVGLLYIMFLAGLEIDLDVVRRHKSEAAVFGGLALVISFALAFGLGLVLGFDWPGAALLAAAISSHTLIAYPMIERMDLVHERPMVAAVGGTLLTDTAALIVLIVVLQVSGSDGGAFGWVWPIIMFTVVAAIALFAVPRVTRWVFDTLGTTRAESALFVLGILVLLATVAEEVGAEDILGAFLAGICLNRVLKGREELFEHLIFAGRMLFIPFFFIETGMRLRLEVFADMNVWLMAGSILLVIIVGKTMAAWIAGHLFDYGRLARFVMIGLTIPQAAATLAVTTTASDAGLVSDELLDAIIIVIFITCLAGAITVRFAGQRLAGAHEQKDFGTEHM